MLSTVFWVIPHGMLGEQDRGPDTLSQEDGPDTLSQEDGSDTLSQEDGHIGLKRY
jgi:hypothetical protein